jgi:FMN phosphatase YigB (HAD superfamily)
MIGDDLHADVAGGRAAGLATVWVDHAGAGPPRGTAPDRVVRALADLLEPD